MKKAIITWASQWLGLELCKLFSEQWYQVIWLSRSKPDMDNIIHIQTDFTSTDSITDSANYIKTEYRDIALIINCAAIWYIESLDETDDAHTTEMFQVNLTGQHHFLSLLSDTIKTNNTDIVFIWATIGYKSNEFMPLYSVTKRGLRWLVENRRHYLKSTASRVIHISPWWLNTESNIWPSWRETIISKKTNKPIWTLIDTTTLAEFIYSIVQLPASMEVSEVIINRK